MTEYNVEKMYTYLKGYITGAGFTESMKALDMQKTNMKGNSEKMVLLLILFTLYKWLVMQLLLE